MMSSGGGGDCCSGVIKMKKCNFRLVLLLAFYGLFLILGAAIFSAIESPLEVAEVKNMRDRKSSFLRTHSCLSGKLAHLFLLFLFYFFWHGPPVDRQFDERVRQDGIINWGTTYYWQDAQQCQYCWCHLFVLRLYSKLLLSCTTNNKSAIVRNVEKGLGRRVLWHILYLLLLQISLHKKRTFKQGNHFAEAVTIGSNNDGRAVNRLTSRLYGATLSGSLIT